MKGSISHKRPPEQSGGTSHQKQQATEGRAREISSACPFSLKELQDALKRFFGYDSFRGPQEDAIRAVLSGRDCFCLMPTGGGKSLCYELPAVIKPGVTLVVSPLIALMENQVTSLKQKNIAAEFLSSTRAASDRMKIYEDIDSGRPTLRLLYVTPELIATDGFMGKLQKMHGRGLLRLVAIDEAHCISSWGHDFRPSYRKLCSLRSALAGVPILALTATAAKAVRNDIIQSLRLHKPVILMSSFNRPNIFYEVRYKELLEDLYKDLLRTLTTTFCGQCVIIYCLARNTCDDIANRLLSEGVPCNVYHAGMKDALRSKALDEWTSGKVNIVVATVAFGMGIDRADVRLVCHFNVPKTLEGFYQESGRAGRDGNPARSLVYYGLDDCRTMQFILRKELNNQKSKTDKDTAQHAVEAFSDVVKFCEEVSCRRQKVLAHFGEKTTPALCNKTCDVCKFPSRVENDVNSLRSTALTRGRGGTDRVFIQGVFGGGEDRVFNGTRPSEFWGGQSDSGEEAESISSPDDEVEKQAVSAARAAVGKKSTSIDQRLKQLMAAEERFSATLKRPSGEMRHALTESSRETARQRLMSSVEKNVQNNISQYSESADATIMALAFEEDIFIKYGRKGRPVYNSQVASMVRWLATASATQVQEQWRECAGVVGAAQSAVGGRAAVDHPTGKGDTSGLVEVGLRNNIAIKGVDVENKEVVTNGCHSSTADGNGAGRGEALCETGAVTGGGEGGEIQTEKMNGAEEVVQEQGREAEQVQKAVKGAEGKVKTTGIDNKAREIGGSLDPAAAEGGAANAPNSDADVVAEHSRPRPRILSFSEFMKKKQEAKEQSAQASDGGASKRKREEQSYHGQGHRREPSSARREKEHHRPPSQTGSKRHRPQV